MGELVTVKTIHEPQRDREKVVTKMRPRRKSLKGAMTFD